MVVECEDICIHAWIRIAGLVLCLCFVQLHPVQGASRTKAAKKKTSKQVKIETRKPPRIKSHDLKAWDKFDVVSHGVMQDFEVGGGIGLAKHIAA